MGYCCEVLLLPSPLLLIVVEQLLPCKASCLVQLELNDLGVALLYDSTDGDKLHELVD